MTSKCHTLVHEIQKISFLSAAIVSHWFRVTCLLWALLPRGAAAQPVSPLEKPAHLQAREHLARGNKLYSVREFEAAIAEYKAGALLEDAPVFQYNLAQSYRLLGNRREALWHYERFMRRTEPPEPLRSSIVRFIDQLRSELAAERRNADTTPTNDVEQVQKDPHARNVETHWYDDRLGWAILGTGAGAVLAGATLLVWGQSLDQDANNEPRELQRAALRSRASTRRIAGVVLGSVGMLGLAIGSVKLAVHSNGANHALVSVAGMF